MFPDTGLQHTSQPSAATSLIKQGDDPVATFEECLSSAAMDGDWQSYRALRDELRLTPQMFHDKIMNAFKTRHHPPQQHTQPNIEIAREILKTNIPVKMLGTPLEWAFQSGSVELVKLILANLMASKPDALAAYQDEIIRRGAEQEESPSAYVDRDRSFFLNEPVRICIASANWKLCAVLLPSYIECTAYGAAHGALHIGDPEKLDISTFSFIPLETCYKMLALCMPKFLKQMILCLIATAVPPDTKVFAGGEAFPAHRSVFLHWSPSSEGRLAGDDCDQGGYTLNFDNNVKPGAIQDVLDLMYGLPFDEHRAEDWKAVMKELRKACKHLKAVEFTDHTYWVPHGTACGEDAEQPLPDDDAASDEDYDGRKLMTDSDSDAEAHFYGRGFRSTKDYCVPMLLTDSDSDVRMETAIG
ncbi:hypothetical protein BJY00DRAFT_319408 [Aspergillus carlsbadensis]|nr:hypothetical protein BJY00DRAFT_319408 [Aspergillus carlsbadensis]